MKGRMAIFKGPHMPFEMREYPIPEVGEHDVLAKITMSMICGSDLHFWRGDIPIPSVVKDGAGVLGHEMVGTVYAKGSGVTADSRGVPLKEGDRITYTYFAGCMSCPHCMRGAVSSCASKRMFISEQPGVFPFFTAAFGDYFYLGRGHSIFKVPDELPDNLVAPINCSLSQVAFGLHLANVSLGESIVIQGAGGLGLYATALAKERGASPIIVIDGIKSRLRLAEEFGADEIVDMGQYPSAPERVARVLQIVGPAGADVAVEVVGLPQVFIEGLQMVRPGGRYCVMGQVSRGDAGTVPFTPAMLLGKNIVSAGGYDPWVLPVAMDFMARNLDRYPFHKLVSHQYPLTDITQAFQDSEWAKEGSENLAVTRTALVP
ncbi:MAG: zinc-binding dehydrogenase [Chloroflexi bacterium]|nr:zinc-binding dehydrogenase [Chloroflexota bacterium]